VWIHWDLFLVPPTWSKITLLGLSFVVFLFFLLNIVRKKWLLFYKLNVLLLCWDTITLRIYI
jgi:hypothetical protein